MVQIETLLTFLSKCVPLSTYKYSNNIITITCSENYFHLLCIFLLKQTYLQFKILTSISGLDLLNKANRFMISYDFLSLQYGIRISIERYTSKITTNLSSLTYLFPSAGWWEREIWDLYGIFFFNNTSLRRILTDYGFSGFPLRKDFPLSGYQEVAYTLLKQNCTYINLELNQLPKNEKALSVAMRF